MKKNKHAYLIIAHHEFEVLQKLIEALDDERNDIYIHIDKKVKILPTLYCKVSRLFIIDNRVDVRWGHVSQIESEYALFEASFNSDESYSRYHLISGTHMPLKSQDEIHIYFDHYQNKEVLNYLYTDDYEANFKINRYHFFLRNYRSKLFFFQRIVQLFWHIFLKGQYVLGIQKKEPKIDAKANNWISITASAIAYILREKEFILKMFRYSFCGDEFFVPFLLGKSRDQFEVLDDKKLLFNEFLGSFPRTITEKDYDFLIASDYLFARKFSVTNVTVVNRILEHIK